MASSPTATAVCLLAALIPIAFASPLFEPYIAAKQLLLTGGAAILLLLWAGTARDFPLSSLWMPISAMAAIGLLSLLKVTRYETAVTLACALVVFVVTLSEMRDASWREQLTSLVMAAGTAEAIYVLLQVTAGDPLLPVRDLAGKWRAFGTFGNPNWTGEFLAAAILVTLGRLTAKFSRTGAVAAAVMMAALGATFARGAWLSLAVAAAAFFLCRSGTLPTSVRKTLLASAAIATMAICALATFAPDTQRYLLNIESLRGRVWMWLVSARMVVDFPFGVGLGNFGIRFAEVQARLFQTELGRNFIHNASFTTQAHNDYLQFVVETGILAIPAIAVLLWMIIRRGKVLSQDSIALGCWAGAIALLVNGLFASPLYLPGSLAMTAILLGAAEASLARFRPMNLSWPRRIGLCAAAFVFAGLAGRWCWDRGIAEYDTQSATAAISLHGWPRALARLESARPHDPNWIEIYKLMGRAQLADRSFTLAAVSYKHASDLGMDSEVMIGEATALIHAGQRAEAIKVIEKLSWLRPDLDWPRQQLAKQRALAAQTEEHR